MTEAKTSHGVAWAALAISLISLVVAWAGYNRAGRDLEQQIQDQTAEIREEVRQDLAFTEARARIMVIRARIAAGQNLNEAQQELTETRRDLRESFANVDEETKEQWQQIDTTMAKLEGQLRANSADALTTLNNIIDELRKDIATDEN